MVSAALGYSIWRNQLSPFLSRPTNWWHALMSSSEYSSMTKGSPTSGVGHTSTTGAGSAPDSRWCPRWHPERICCRRNQHRRRTQGGNVKYEDYVYCNSPI
ncbi:hypothetical protein A2U01_0019343 [Trifolium medium]|uniref:Uncharacterized protein n=1 Tax=Trifolium medium TaxID=97028 RepID=A0A392NF23_9FABA|nr:hypothetical protein [Trifolium medium]